jgi:hypothetical protein
MELPTDVGAVEAEEWLWLSDAVTVAMVEGSGRGVVATAMAAAGEELMRDEALTACRTSQ